ncbi:DEAD/DEAH box helicase [Opitutus sp. ER46]|uniref:DEAD/DEAH box helicase n=1 Tax=Opitutus sp. ER46 TaxID=2161864 RepID=UPI000D314F35|nr:DEAD/DEAH box helicase [Opitutus sp. ER46]PTX90728.1 ATP-dependent helicase [Opitutus sp. ER46]
MLRLHLPPNFAAAVVRNAVPLRVELDLSVPPAPVLLPVLALLQRWCGTPTPPTFIQLNRAQLRELATAAGTQAIFVENGQLTWWKHEDLLRPVEPPPASTATSQAAGPASRRPEAPRGRGFTPVVVDGSEHFLAISLPSREHPQYEDMLALLKENGFALEPSNRKWWLRDRHKTLNFLASHLGELRERFGAELTPNFEKNTARVRPAEITADVGSTGGGFSVGLGVRAGDTDPATLRSAIASNRGYVETGGKVFLLDTRKLERLAIAQRALAGDPAAPVAPQRTVTVSPARVAEVQEILAELSPNFQPPDAWRERSAALRNLTALEPAPVPGELDALLRPYQRLGVAWLWHLQRHTLGGILADEMGLGKTIQALALLSAAQAADPRAGAALVVCPASLLENWRREAARFAPGLRVFVHHAEQRLASADEFTAHDLIITSYGTLTRDQARFTAVEFACVIADEAQHIKNRRSQNAAALRALTARARFLLTGTPVENSLDDLRSLFEFLLPGYITRVPAGLRGDERAWYDERLRAQTAPYILRRTKRSVAPELPDKIEQVVWCELPPAQAALYRETQETSERELFDLEAAGASEAKLKFAALTQLLRLRQICCDPRLVRPGDVDGGAPAEPGSVPSAKLDAFRELLEEAVDDGHRVLVFSQFTSLLALLRAELDAQAMPYCYLDGSMPARARQAEVDRFQRDADVPLFLLSLKAGGTGLNLTGADTVVIYDPWWNPAAEAQATDRAHRIGQKRTVTSYKLIASGTVEEKVLALQAEKRALLADVFEASDAAAARLSLADLKGLLARR